MDYIRTYLQQLHETKDVFLRYGAGKQARKKAEDVWKKYTEGSKRHREAVKGLTTAQRARLAEDQQVERGCRIDQVLKEDSHLNFPKLHPLSHYADQIAEYGTLLQYSTEICEGMHKPLTDAYRRSNYVDSIPQVIDTYTREDNFAVRELNMQHWARKDPSLVDDL